jgi:hypothetical protein
MTKTLDTLVPDIYEIFTRTHVLSEENLEAFAEGVKGSVKRAIEEAGTKDTKHLRMSIMGLPNRKIWYMLNTETPQVLKPSDYIKFIFGHILEHLLLLLVKEAGHIVANEQLEVVVDGIPGTLDCTIDGIPIDCKSASAYSFKKFKNDTLHLDDPFGYIGQISGYAEALGIEEGGFLVINKESGELVVTLLDSMDLLNFPSRVTEVKDFISEPYPPADKCYPDEIDGKSGNKVLSKSCGWCAFKFDCWKESNGGEGLRVFEYANGPKYFTEVNRAPRVEEVTNDS